MPRLAGKIDRCDPHGEHGGGIAAFAPLAGCSTKPTSGTSYRLLPGTNEQGSGKARRALPQCANRSGVTARPCPCRAQVNEGLTGVDAPRRGRGPARAGPLRIQWPHGPPPSTRRGNRAALDAPGCSAVADRPGHQRPAPLRAQRAPDARCGEQRRRTIRSVTGLVHNDPGVDCSAEPCVATATRPVPALRSGD